MMVQERHACLIVVTTLFRARRAKIVAHSRDYAPPAGILIDSRGTKHEEIVNIRACNPPVYGFISARKHMRAATSEKARFAGLAFETYDMHERSHKAARSTPADIRRDSGRPAEFFRTPISR